MLNLERNQLYSHNVFVLSNVYLLRTINIKIFLLYFILIQNQIFTFKMATSQKEFKQIPEIDFKVSSTGITVLCSRFYTPRFIQFDITGKCESCRADSAEIDFLVTIDGVTIYCSRMRQPIFVPFDYRYIALPHYCLFRVKTRGKIFNIEHGKKLQYDILNDAINSVFERQNHILIQTQIHEQNMSEKTELTQNIHPLETVTDIKDSVEATRIDDQKTSPSQIEKPVSEEPK